MTAFAVVPTDALSRARAAFCVTVNVLLWSVTKHKSLCFISLQRLLLCLEESGFHLRELVYVSLTGIFCRFMTAIRL